MPSSPATAPWNPYDVESQALCQQSTARQLALHAGECGWSLPSSYPTDRSISPGRPDVREIQGRRSASWLVDFGPNLFSSGLSSRISEAGLAFSIVFCARLSLEAPSCLSALSSNRSTSHALTSGVPSHFSLPPIFYFLLSAYLPVPSPWNRPPLHFRSLFPLCLLLEIRSCLM